jgi:hypothetical protein
MQDEIPDVVHPIRGGPLTPIERELWRLRMLALEVQQMLRGFNSLNNVAAELPDGLIFSLMNYGLVLIAKFFEIWDDFGRLAKTDPRIVTARRVASPLVDRLQVWPGLETFRNTVLAHPYSTKDGRLVGPWYLLQQHRAPTYHAETFLLLNCVNLAVAAVLAVFTEEYAALKSSFGSIGADPQAGPGIFEGKDIGPETKRLAMEVNERLRAEGIPLINDVFSEFRRATRGPRLPST